MIPIARMVAELAAATLIIGTILLWAAIFEHCHYVTGGNGVLACVFGG